ncbi:O-antigen ligase [Conyzicola nivalis]|uniref:O-antigen ligase n=1 Tax=Conyzicola nivalis TaxID=1477021 RepID=A0ABV2QPR5_9MICO
MTDTEQHPVTTDTPPAPLAPLKPRIGTIVWGCILLVVAAIAIAASQVDFGDLTPTVIVWSIIGFGGILVVAGIVTAIVRAATRIKDDPPVG